MRINSLRFKILGTAAMAMVLLFAVIFFISRSILTASYSQLEKEKTSIEIKGAKQMLEEQKAQMSSLLQDWAHWDDTYEYVAQPNERYIQSNFTEDTFSHLRINAVLISNAKGEIVYQRGFDYAAMKSWAIPKALEKAARSGGVLTKLSPGAAISGLLQTPSGVLFVASSEILPSSEESQSRGTMVMARRIDSTMLEKIGSVIGATVRLQSVSENLDSTESAAMQQLLDGAESVIEHVSDNEVHGHALLKDIDGKASLSLSTVSDRSIYLQGQSSLNMVVWSVGAIAVMMLFFAWLFDRVVLSRVAQISEDITKIGNARDNVSRLPEMRGDDELSRLAKYINAMLDKLDISQKALMSLTDKLFTANKQLQEASDDLERQVAQRTNELTEALFLANKGQKAKDDFLATISHEIRTPLNGIISSANLLLLSEKIDPEVKKLAEIIHRSGDTLLVLINDILDYSKLEAGQFEISPSATEIHEEMNHVAELFRPLAEGRHIDFINDVSPDIPETLWVDGTRLRQVVGNLLNNAIKFTQTGSVTLSAGWDPETSMLFCSVRDTGIGISKEGIEKLFKPFSQVDSSTSRKYGGTGLGLVICSRLVEKMGGGMRVDSVPGEGSTFSFNILATPSAKAIKEKANEPATVTGKSDLRILLAEDNQINQIVALKMLERLGLTADLARNGLEAVEKVKAQTYDIILMDMQMPEMDGLEATRAIRSLGLEPRPKIIGLTANAFDSDRQLCLEAGMDAFQTKPLMIDELRQNVFAT